MTKRNPKYEGSNIVDCIPQSGRCPHNCSQCFFNRPGAFYTETPSVPTPEEVGDGIVRMNGGHDSNMQRELVIETAKQYKNYFFNTSVPRFDFPGPVVLTANPQEEDGLKYHFPIWAGGKWRSPAPNLMFVRLRVSATNLQLVDKAVQAWTEADVPVVLTFMAYYDGEPPMPATLVLEECYKWRVRHINAYWCPTKAFMWFVRSRYTNRLVSRCGGATPYCRDCRNCETYYWQTIKRMRGE